MENSSDLNVDLQFYKSLSGKNAFEERMKGVQPVIMVDGLPHYVNMNFGLLEPADAKYGAININDLQKDPVTRKLSFYYNRETRERVSVGKDLTTFPPRVVKVEIPNQYFLDPVAMARKNGRDPKDYHFYGIPLKMYRVAKVIPLRNTELLALAKNNCERLGIEPPKSINRTKRLTKKRKGPGL